jgi:hypothetical protein
MYSLLALDLIVLAALCGVLGLVAASGTALFAMLYLGWLRVVDACPGTDDGRRR